MKSVLDEPLTNGSPAISTGSNCGLDEVEAVITRKIEEGINEAKAAFYQKLEDGRVQAERLLKQGQYAVEDGVSELAHKIKKNPISFLGIAFAVGAACGLLLSRSSHRQNTN